MILLINSHNLLGRAVVKRLLTDREQFISIQTANFFDNVTVSYDDGGEFWVVSNCKVYLREFSAVYCGYYGGRCLPAIKDRYEAYYLASCWEAYLQYALAKIPRKMGVMAPQFSLGSFLQLPAFYNLIKGFGLKSPRYSYSFNDKKKPKGNNYFCNSLYAESHSDFYKATNSAVLIVSRHFGMWGKIIILGSNLYFFTFEMGLWVERDLDAVTKCSIRNMLDTFAVTLGKIILRYNAKMNEYMFYGITLKLAIEDICLLPKDISDVAVRFLKR